MPNRTAVLVTNKGTIKVKLFDAECPGTVGNFEKLAGSGFYDGTKFHRVISNFMIQGGDPNTKTGKGAPGTGGPGYTVECELNPKLKHSTGTLSMAHAGGCQHDKRTGAKTGGSCSNGSQFFITDGPTPVAPGMLPMSELKHASAFELRVKGRVLGVLPLSPVPSATFTAEGGYKPPPEFTWSAAAEDELSDRLARLMGTPLANVALPYFPLPVICPP